MAKSSLDYTELAGLNIALSNLQNVDITYRDSEWLAVADWMKTRIKTLSNK